MNLPSTTELDRKLLLSEQKEVPRETKIQMLMDHFRVSEACAKAMLGG